MSLPTPAQLNELGSRLVAQGKLSKGKWYSYKGMLQTLERNRGTILAAAGGGAAKAGAGVASGTGAALYGATGVFAIGPASLTLVPFGAVLAPWIAAADIVRVAGDIFELHDLREDAAKGSGSRRYTCGCGHCADNIRYVVDKKERNVARVAVGAATLGVSALGFAANSIYKKFWGDGRKETVSRGLIASAQAGCTVAIASIFLMCGNWEFLRGGNAGIMRRAVAVMTSEDGWSVLKAEW